MSENKNLTKIITDANGNECVACALYGTDECRTIHNGQGCYGCSMLAVILNRLYCYETHYQKEKNKYADSS